MQLLATRDYASIPIREIVSVAGTGLGSFYEYFASKDDLARVCLHLRSKALLRVMQEAGERCAGRPLAVIAAALVEALADAHRGPPSEWAAHYLLERHLSGADAYRVMYERFVQGWSLAFAAARDPLAPARQRDAALLGHTLVYGLFSNAFIASHGEAVDLARLACCARDAVQACIASQRHAAAG